MEKISYTKFKTLASKAPNNFLLDPDLDIDDSGLNSYVIYRLDKNHKRYVSDKYYMIGLYSVEERDRKYIKCKVFIQINFDEEETNVYIRYNHFISEYYEYGFNRNSFIYYIDDFDLDYGMAKRLIKLDKIKRPFLRKLLNQYIYKLYFSDKKFYNRQDAKNKVGLIKKGDVILNKGSFNEICFDSKKQLRKRYDLYSNLNYKLHRVTNTRIEKSKVKVFINDCIDLFPDNLSVRCKLIKKDKLYGSGLPYEEYFILDGNAKNLVLKAMDDYFKCVNYFNKFNLLFSDKIELFKLRTKRFFNKFLD